MLFTLCDLLDASTALAACCGFDLCHKYTGILYLYLYFTINTVCMYTVYGILKISNSEILLRGARMAHWVMVRLDSRNANTTRHGSSPLRVGLAARGKGHRETS